MPMEPGHRDRAVTIQQGVAGTAPSGAPIVTWTTLATPVWMSKRDMRGDERWKTDQIAAKFDSIWEMNYRSDMDPELVDVPKLRRLVYQGRTYQIVSAVQIGRRGGVQLATIASTKA